MEQVGPDFNVETQAGLFRSWSGVFGGRKLEKAVRASARRGGPRILGVAALLVVLLLGGLLQVRRSSARRPPATRMYVRLRRAAARAGLRVPPGLTPLELLARIRGVAPAAEPPAARVVDLYLRFRYGGEAPDKSDLRRMRRALGAARRRLLA